MREGCEKKRYKISDLCFEVWNYALTVTLIIIAVSLFKRPASLEIRHILGALGFNFVLGHHD